MRVIEKWYGPVYCDAMLVLRDSRKGVQLEHDEMIELFGSLSESDNWRSRQCADMLLTTDAMAKSWAHSDSLGQLWMIERVK